MAYKFDSGESAFNFALAYLESLSNSLKMCKLAAIMQKPDDWYHWLRAAFREVSMMTKIEEDKEFEDKFKEITSLINNPILKIKKKREILSMLDKLEMKLRKKIQQKKIGLPTRDDPRYAILKR